jgi:molybdenum cofactor biosynthesis enzyme MoaA
MKEVKVRVTNRCHTLCAHCGVSSGRKAAGTLTLQVAERFLDAFIARWGVPVAWKLSGGEPTLYPEMWAERKGYTMR